MKKDINTQNIAWLWDLYKRDMLDLDPPYQRRSVWNQRYKDFFIDTILVGYPAPPIFLYREISSDGIMTHNVVDGKQRLTSIFEFIQDLFPISDECTIVKYRGKYFSELEDDPDKMEFWKYIFAIVYIDTKEDNVITAIFDRLNRNVAKLTKQELRHAKLDGEFINTASELAEKLPSSIPRILESYKDRMKDVEFVSELLLFLEEGVRSYTADELDKAFDERDSDWEFKDQVEKDFNTVVKYLNSIESIANSNGITLSKTRIKNKADFYSLFGAVYELIQCDKLPTDNLLVVERIIDFVSSVDDEDKRDDDITLSDYYKAVRAASNRKPARIDRINILMSVITETEYKK